MDTKLWRERVTQCIVKEYVNETTTCQSPHSYIVGIYIAKFSTSAHILRYQKDKQAIPPHNNQYNLPACYLFSY